MPKQAAKKTLVRPAVKRERFLPDYATKEELAEINTEIKKLWEAIEQLKEELREQS
jgi:hypothetical protein